MSQSSATPEQQGQQSRQKVGNAKKTELSSPAKQVQVAHSMKVTRIDDISKLKPEELARQLLDEQKKKNAMPRLQQQLQNSSNSATQHNVVTSTGGAAVTIRQKEILHSSPGGRRVQRGALAVTRPQLQQGLLQQNVILNNNQQQRFQAVCTPQSTIPNPQRQASPNVRFVCRTPNPNTQIVPRGLNMSPEAAGPRALRSIAPKQQAIGKQTIPANCAQGSRLAFQVPPNSQFQPNAETLILVSPAGQGDCNQVVTAVPNTQGNQVFYTVAKGQPILVKQPQQPTHVAVMANPPNTVVKTQRIVHVKKRQSSVIAQQGQVVSVKPQQTSIPNGVSINKSNMVGQGNSEESQGGGEDDEEEEEEGEEEDQTVEGLQNCPTLAEEQRLLSMNQLTAGEICRIEIDKGKPFKVLWTGENLVRLSDSHSHADNVKGGGVKKTLEAKNLKGNATGLHMTRPQESNAGTVSGRNWQYSSEGKDLRRPPIRPDSTSNQTGVQSGDNSNNQSEAQRRVPSEPNKFAVCKCCGHMSQDYTQCDYCQRPLPPDSKFYYPKGEPESVKVPVVTKNSEEGKVVIGAELFYSKTSPRILGKRGRTSKSAKRKKSEPEMVTISSSEEEDDSCGDAAAAQSLIVAGKGLVINQQQQQPQQQGNQAAVIQQQFLHMPLNNSQVANVLTRRQRMEDQQGNTVKKPGRKKKKLSPAEQAKVLEELAGHDDEDMLPDTVALDTRGIRIGSLRGSAYAPVVFADTGITLSIECKELSIGELVITVQDLIRVLYHVGFKMPCIFLQTSPECTNRIRLKCGMADKNDNPYYDPMSPDDSQKLICIILDKLNQEEREKLTCMFEHYDAVTHVRHNLVENIDYNTANVLLAKSSGTKNQIIVPVSAFLPQTSEGMAGSIKFFTASFPSAMSILHNYGDGEESDMDEDEDDEPKDRSRSPSPPLSVFAGPIVKLFTYPPAPATGGITVTNEDLFCLNEGEFLNDVIIDFYLKYLYLNTLEDHEREKTHIFSSFFYRRLTQKAKRVTEEGETPQQKRHNRVKTWTRHVDLFKKDFIIVPINESAHWYLAIICFPWMMKPEKLNVIMHEVGPSPPAATENNEESQEPDQQDTQVAEDSQRTAETPRPSSEDAKAENQDQKVEEPETEKTEKTENAKMTEEKVIDQTSNKTAANQEVQKEQNGGVEGENGQEVAGNAAEDTEKEKSSESEVKKESSGEPKSPQDAQTSIEGCTGTSTKTVTRQACILVFDSLAGPSRSSVVRTLREYLQIEWNAKKAKTEGPRVFDKDTIKGANPKCPQQTNYSDCGVYLLQYVESFFEDPVQDYVIPMKALGTWFPEERVRCKREELRELLLALKSKLNPNLEYDCSKDILS